MSPSSDSRRECLKLVEWPPADRAAWERGTAATSGRFTQRGVADRLAAPTLDKAYEGYGRWLGFLRHQGWLDHAAAPADRPTQERAFAYFDALRALGNRDHTIVGRFLDLEAALRIMAPGLDFGWLTRPGGVPIRRRLKMERRSFTLHHPKALFDWDLEMMQQAVSLSADQRRRVMLRDGLLIALLSCRGMRLRAVTALRLGSRLWSADGEWRLLLEPEDQKTQQALEYGFPPALVPWLERYLKVERAELLDGRVEDALWVNWGGTPLGLRGVEKRIRWWSAKRFGPTEAFGPHRFRHCIGTSGPIDMPDAPGASAALLGISAGVHRQHYDRGNRATAASRFHHGLADMRRQTAALARNGYQLHHPADRDEDNQP